VVSRKHSLLLTISAACISVSSCGSSAENVESAKRGVTRFHAQLDSEQYAALYAASDDGFRRTTNEPDFTKLLEAIHRKLGAVQQADLRNTMLAWRTGQGSTVTLIYATDFASGNATEKFVWHVTNGTSTLYGYYIDSNDLITR
jgi:hypothetical protein